MRNPSHIKRMDASELDCAPTEEMRTPCIAGDRLAIRTAKSGVTHMFQVNDLVVYGNLGISVITDVCYQNLVDAPDEQLYYTLKPLHQQCVIHTPVNSTKVFMRRVISKEEAEALIDRIPSIRPEPYHNKAISQLTEHYTAAFHTHELIDLVKLTMSIYAKRQEVEAQNRKFSVVDERFLQRAEDLLFSELSVALAIPRESVPDYIASRVNVLAENESLCQGTPS